MSLVEIALRDIVIRIRVLALGDVVRDAGLRNRKNTVSFHDLSEDGSVGAFRSNNIRMVLFNHGSVRFLNLLRSCIALDAENGVVALLLVSLAVLGLRGEGSSLRHEYALLGGEASYNSPGEETILQHY